MLGMALNLKGTPLPGGGAVIWPSKGLLLGVRRLHNLSAISGTNNAPRGTTINRLYLIPWVLAIEAAIDQLSIRVSTAAGAGGRARLGMYKAAASQLPGDLLVDAGEVVTDVVGKKDRAVNLVLTPGLYWAALHIGVSNPSLNGVPESAAWIGSPIGVGDSDSQLNGNGNSMTAQDVAYGPLPLNVVPGAVENTGLPNIWARFALA